mmetsp:Transcript_23032/g.54573  ORF Transcript_23032/g.54573 Transcript_23032/m.54573 type:complete len:225 (-) Transcript_23032:81-755(-)
MSGGATRCTTACADISRTSAPPVTRRAWSRSGSRDLHSAARDLCSASARAASSATCRAASRAASARHSLCSRICNPLRAGACGAATGTGCPGPASILNSAPGPGASSPLASAARKARGGRMGRVTPHVPSLPVLSVPLLALALASPPLVSSSEPGPVPVAGPGGRPAGALPRRSASERPAPGRGIEERRAWVSGCTLSGSPSREINSISSNGVDPGSQLARRAS